MAPLHLPLWQLSTFRPVEWHWTSDSPSTSDEPQRRKQRSPGRARRYTGRVARHVTPCPSTSVCCGLTVSSTASWFSFYSCALSPCFLVLVLGGGQVLFFFSPMRLYFSSFLSLLSLQLLSLTADASWHLSFVLVFVTRTRNEFLLSSSLRRIDVSPRAFKKHAQLFDAVKNSEDGTYKVTEHFAEWSMSDRTNSEWVSHMPFRLPSLNARWRSSTRERGAQSLSNASAK